MFKLLVSLFQVNHPKHMHADTKTRRNIAWFVPSLSKHINGFSFGIANTPDRYKQTINGLSCELLGAGYITPFLFMASDHEGYLSGSHNKLKNNGLIVGPTLFSGRINGIFFSGIIGTNYDLSGVSFSLINSTLYRADGVMIGLTTFADIMNGLQVALYNYSGSSCGIQFGFLNHSKRKSKGLQFGLLNWSETHTGIQVGLWNKNHKRALPFVNWNFS